MTYSEQTRRQAERAISKIAAKFPASADGVAPLTDIHLRVNPDSGELLAYDDEGHEINRCVIDEWINLPDEDFYGHVAEYMRTVIRGKAATVDGMGLLKPFSVVLEDEDGEPVGELYLADGDTVIVGGDLMNGLESDLDSFLATLKLE